jgi:hypothetical protein
MWNNLAKRVCPILNQGCPFTGRIYCSFWQASAAARKPARRILLHSQEHSELRQLALWFRQSVLLLLLPRNRGAKCPEKAVLLGSRSPYLEVRTSKRDPNFRSKVRKSQNAVLPTEEVLCCEKAKSFGTELALQTISLPEYPLKVIARRILPYNAHPTSTQLSSPLTSHFDRKGLLNEDDSSWRSLIRLMKHHFHRQPKNQLNLLAKASQPQVDAPTKAGLSQTVQKSNLQACTLDTSASRTLNMASGGSPRALVRARVRAFDALQHFPDTSRALLTLHYPGISSMKPRQIIFC